MGHVATSGLTAALLFFSVLAASALEASEGPARRRPGRLVVRERAGLTSAALADALRKHRARRLRPLARLGASVVEVEERDLPFVEMELRRSGLFKAVERDYLAETAEIPNDTYFGTQWGLTKIAAPLSWAISTGSPSVPVAVLDTGAQLDHPDLLGRLLPGYDFYNGDADPSDDHGHGTRMTGIIVARKGNALGVAGAAPGSMAIPVKVLGADGAGPYSDVADGITYAVDQGARVVSLSLVGGVSSGLLQSAIDYATAHGVIVVAASGNSGTDAPAYPAANDGAVAVGATSQSDLRPAFSNYGAWLSLAAPGVDIVTTTLGATYSSSTGTSPAAAMASGAFALLLGANPTMAREVAIQRMESGAADLGTNGWDPYYGWGRIDSYGALVPGEVGSPPPDEVEPKADIMNPAKGSLVYGMVPVDVAASDDVSVQRVELFVDDRVYATETTPPYSFLVDTSTFVPGKHKLRAYAYDTGGNSRRSRAVKVAFTPGVGILIHRAKVHDDGAQISASFSLPPGATFDPSSDAISVTMSTASGTFLAAAVQAGELEASGGQARATVLPDVPSAGSVRISVKPTGAQPIYKLAVKATKLQGMGSVDAIMNLSVQVGSDLLSQGLTLRPKRADLLVYP